MQVHGATTTEQARMMIERKRYSIIVTDLRMPNGFASDLLIEMKAAIRDTPIIIISADADDLQDHADRMIENGLSVIKCLAKPIETKELLALL